MPRAKKPSTPQPDAAARIALAEAVLGHTFADKDLALRALTHPSAAEDSDPGSDYERLEFLGDSVVGFVIAEELYRRFPSMQEGGLTRIKVSLVAGSVLARVSGELGLADALVVGESERGTGGRGMASALENVYEALVAALYIEAGIGAAREWVLSTLGPLISQDVADTPENPKSELQEITQARGEAPVYRTITQAGPPHARTFTCQVEVAEKVLGEGTGRTKKEAEAEAARVALNGLVKSRRRRPGQPS